MEIRQSLSKDLKDILEALIIALPIPGIDSIIASFKPPIFWKDKDRIKNILKIWSTNNLEKFLSNLNIIETEFKRNDLNQDTQFYYFLTQNLSKITLKNTNNFI
mgnify:CR=1 FL=1